MSRTRSLLSTCSLCMAGLLMPITAPAQTEFVVQGRVLEEGGTSGIQLATVTLEGFDETLSNADGDFHFAAVPPGTYTLRVSALGYADAGQLVVVDRDLMVSVALRVDPLELDPLAVDATFTDIDGQVLERLAGRSVVVVNAEVLTARGPGRWTDAHGRFEIESVPTGAPLRLVVRAFGYLPVDTILEPSEDGDYVFELETDSVVQRMIDVEVQRLEERAAGRRAVVRPMNRKRILGFAGSATLLDLIEVEYRAQLDRIRCVVIDEKQVFNEVLGVLVRMLPEETERIEFFSGKPQRGDGHLPVYMLRVYTRAFVQDMVAGDHDLNYPTFITTTRPPVCR